MTNFILGIVVGLLIAILNVLACQKRVQEKVDTIEGKGIKTTFEEWSKDYKNNKMAEIVDMTEPLKDISI